jgi:hypothetical protein
MDFISNALAGAIVQVAVATAIGGLIQSYVPDPSDNEPVSKTIRDAATQVGLNGVALAVGSRLFETRDASNGMMYSYALTSSQPGLAKRLELLSRESAALGTLMLPQMRAQ